MVLVKLILLEPFPVVSQTALVQSLFWLYSE